MNAARARGLDVAICLMLLFAPFWMNAIGGYTELATRIVVMGLAAVYFPSATEAVIYVMMALVLLVRPRGLLGEEGRLH